jgi:hypothetical protein
VELRGGFSGAHEFRNSPHPLARRKKRAKGLLTDETILSNSRGSILQDDGRFVVM